MNAIKIFLRVFRTNQGEQKKDLFVVRYLYRPLSLPVSVPLLLLGVRPNHVTFLNFILVVVVSALFALGNPSASLVGSCLFLAIFVFDCVDGNLARYLDQRRYFGKLIDGLVDLLVYLIYAAVAVGNVRQGQNAFAASTDLLAGSAIALCMTFISYFRMRIVNMLAEIQKGGSASDTFPKATPTRIWRMAHALRAAFENLGPLGPILLILALSLIHI